MRIKALKLSSFVTVDRPVLSGGGTAISVCEDCPFGPPDDTLDFDCTELCTANSKTLEKPGGSASGFFNL